MYTNKNIGYFELFVKHLTFYIFNIFYEYLKLIKFIARLEFTI